MTDTLDFVETEKTSGDDLGFDPEALRAKYREERHAKKIACPVDERRGEFPFPHLARDRDEDREGDE